MTSGSQKRTCPVFLPQSTPIPIDLVILIGGNFQANTFSPGESGDAGVQKIRNLLLEKGGFSPDEVPEPLPSNKATFGKLSMRAVEQKIVDEAAGSHGRTVPMALIGYSLGGGMIYDLTRDMFGYNNATRPFNIDMPTNIALMSTVYIDAIDFGDGKYVAEQMHALEADHVLLEGQGNRPVGRSGQPNFQHFNYFESIAAIPTQDYHPFTHPVDALGGKINDLPSGKISVPVVTGDVQVDVDSGLKYDALYRQILKQAPKTATPDNSFSHTSIDDDPIIINAIQRDMTQVFHKAQK